MYLRIVHSKCSAVKSNVKLPAYIIMFLLSSTYCSCAQSVCASWRKMVWLRWTNENSTHSEDHVLNVSTFFQTQSA